MFKFSQLSLLKFSKTPISLKRRFYSSSTIVNERIEFFDKTADDYWNLQKGSMVALHMTHAHRVSFICDQLIKDKCATSGAHLLSGLKIADVGCGAGILSESLAKLGADVTGFDPSGKSIESAKAHAKSIDEMPGSLEYLHSTAEEHVLMRKGYYDVAIACFILEHVRYRSREEFIKNCLSLLKPNGSLFIMHANRTPYMFFTLKWQIYVKRTYLKELVKYKNLLRNEDIVQIVCRENTTLRGQSGVAFPWIGHECKLTTSKSQLNIMHFTKNN